MSRRGSPVLDKRGSFPELMPACLPAMQRLTSQSFKGPALCASDKGEHAQATKNMAALAADMRQLRSFLHVSTAYVNCFLGRQKHVEERQYPIMFNGKPMNHAAVIEELQDLPPKEAESRVRPLTCIFDCPPCTGRRECTKPAACSSA